MPVMISVDDAREITMRTDILEMVGGSIWDVNFDISNVCVNM